MALASSAGRSATRCSRQQAAEHVVHAASGSLTAIAPVVSP